MFVKQSFRSRGAQTVIIFFTNRVVNICNSLPDYVVHADTVNCFKSRHDTFWSNQDLVYNFKAEISGTGSRSEVV